MAREIAPEVKAAALGDLATGSSVNATARKYGVSRRSVQTWRDAAHVPAASAPQEKRDAIGEQLFDYLAASIEALRLQVHLFGDRTWLEKQSAGDLAVLHGVISDKTVRLLAALRSNGEPEQPASVVDATATPDSA